MRNSNNEPAFLQEIFLEEAWEKIEKLEEFIEKKTGVDFIEVQSDEVESLFRTLHGLKGSASMMGYPAISETAHSAEDLFAYLRDEIEPTQEDLDTILQLLRSVSGYLKRELRCMETDEEVTGFGWAVVKRIKNFLANVDSDNVPEGPSYQIAYTRKGKQVIPFINFLSLIPQIERMANIMSKELGKEYRLNILGCETEVPRDIFEKVSMTVIQLVKNSIDHGLESKDLRVSLGKTPIGEISLNIRKTSQRLYIDFRDDGQGLDRGIILRQARKKNLLTKLEENYTDDEVFGFLFNSGFSTKKQIDLFSGRGVGLDVVKASIGSLGGTIRMESNIYMGTTVFIEFPLVFEV